MKVSDKQLILEFFEVLNHRNTQKAGSLLNSDAELYFPKTQPIVGRDRILKFLKILFRQYPELTFNIQRLLQQGGHAAVHWTNQGMNRRNEPYQNEGVTLMQIQDGKLSYISDFFKDTEKL